MKIDSTRVRDRVRQSLYVSYRRFVFDYPTGQSRTIADDERTDFGLLLRFEHETLVSGRVVVLVSHQVYGQKTIAGVQEYRFHVGVAELVHDELVFRLDQHQSLAVDTEY